MAAWLTERDAEWKTWQKASEHIRALMQQADRTRQAHETASAEAAKWSMRWADCEKDYAELETEADCRDRRSRCCVYIGNTPLRNRSAIKPASLEGTERTLTQRLREDKARAEKTSVTWLNALSQKRLRQ